MSALPELSERQYRQALAVVPLERGGLSFIEQLHAASLKPCSCAPNRWLVGTNQTNNTAVLCRPACKMWKCPECSARNARRWIARVINGVNKLDGVWFMFTLTAHAKQRGKKSVGNLRQGWKKLYNRARRQYGTSQYVKVWELHSDGETFHLHGLIDTEIPQRWLKDNAAECGMGYQVEIHEVDNAGQVAGYIAKYFLKSEGVLRDYPEAWPKSLRRIETSRAWPELPDIEAFSEMTWEMFDTAETAKWRLETKRKLGYRTTVLST